MLTLMLNVGLSVGLSGLYFAEESPLPLFETLFSKLFLSLLESTPLSERFLCDKGCRYLLVFLLAHSFHNLEVIL